MQANTPLSPTQRRRQKNKKVYPASTGIAGKLDSRRWIIIQLRNNGATDAQFPLPVTHNTHRIVFNRDEMVIAPAYYLDVLKDACLLRYEEIPDSARKPVAKGQLESTDQASWVGLQYQVDIHEIPDKYQTMDGIWELAELLQSDEDLPPEIDVFWGARLGQSSFTKQNEQFSTMMTEKLKPKSRSKPNANNNS